LRLKLYSITFAPSTEIATKIVFGFSKNHAVAVDAGDTSELVRVIRQVNHLTNCSNIFCQEYRINKKKSIYEISIYYAMISGQVIIYCYKFDRYVIHWRKGIQLELPQGYRPTDISYDFVTSIEIVQDNKSFNSVYSGFKDGIVRSDSFEVEEILLKRGKL
jgi:hypothetical protein